MRWIRIIANKIRSLFTRSESVQQQESSLGREELFKKEWREFLKKQIEENITYFRSAKDIDLIYPNFNKLKEWSQVEALADFFVLLINYESGNNPASQSVDVGNKNNQNTWSIGLMQLSVVDQINYDIRLGYTFNDLLDPIKNIELGIKIMVKQLDKYKKIFIEKGDAGVYWAVIHPGGRYDKSQNIISFLHALKFEYEIESDQVPWLTIAKKELGVKEWN